MNHLRIAALLLLASAAVLFLFMSATTKTEEGEIRLEVYKQARRLDVFAGEKLVRSFRVVLGFDPRGDKETEGDGRTPVGEFYVFIKNDKSRFHLSLGVSYPNSEDAARGLAAQLITPSEHEAIVSAISNRQMPPQKTALGGEIYIHGGGLGKDWTDGCVALENDQMTELFNLVPIGARVTIFP